MLLILAGVTIVTLTGDNGLLQKTSEAQKANIESVAREKIQVEVAGSFDLTGGIDINSLNTNLGRISGLTYNRNPLSSTNKITLLPAIVILNGYEFKIYANGTVGKLDYITAEDNYIGYFADINADGEVDGIIFADLVAGSSKETQRYGNGTYIMPSASSTAGFKNYYVSGNSYTWGNTTNPVLSPSGTGNDRFYVMDLNNFTTAAKTDGTDDENYPTYTLYYWYKNACSHMNPLITLDNFGEGRENTRKMIAKWNSAGTDEGYPDSPQEKQDIWKHIQGKYDEGWFIPSREEWSAFANELEITPSNYNSSYGLSWIYWTSSQGGSGGACDANLSGGNILTRGVNIARNIRLATTF